jgi:hypothetical protein
MESHKIKPEKITKPIQLLGAWLVGLLAIDASFLFAASNLGAASWQSGALTIAAIVNVPIFIGALFMLQTKFRPELQEDSYYSTYLNNRTNELVKIPKKEILLEELERKIELLEKRQLPHLFPAEISSLAKLSYGVNCHLENQVDIESAIFDLGVNLVREFGVDTDAPEDIKVAIGSNLPIELKNEVLGFAKKLGIEYYTTIEPWEDIEEDVLFGAYGAIEGKITYKSA